MIAPAMNTPLVMKGLEQGNIQFDIIYECSDVAGQALAKLGHAPVLSFPSSAADMDPDALVRDRHELLLQICEVGKRHLPTGGAKPGGPGAVVP
ncbi:MAG TPA: hypothetical protein VJ762_13575 [Sphingobium sp.]|nr:hypothetical protein [Sphingobium sp.]